MEMNSNSVAQLISRARTGLRNELQPRRRVGCDPGLPRLRPRAAAAGDEAGRRARRSGRQGLARRRTSTAATAAASPPRRWPRPASPTGPGHPSPRGSTCSATRWPRLPQSIGADWSAVERPGPSAAPANGVPGVDRRPGRRRVRGAPSPLRPRRYSWWSGSATSPARWRTPHSTRPIFAESRRSRPRAASAPPTAVAATDRAEQAPGRRKARPTQPVEPGTGSPSPSPAALRPAPTPSAPTPDPRRAVNTTGPGQRRAAPLRRRRRATHRSRHRHRPTAERAAARSQAAGPASDAPPPTGPPVLVPVDPKIPPLNPPRPPRIP